MKQILFEKWMLFLLCLIPTAAAGPDAALIGAMLAALSLSALSETAERRAVSGLLAACVLLCALWRPCLYFLPLFMYDAAAPAYDTERGTVRPKEVLRPLAAALPLLIHLPRLPLLLCLQLALLSCLALWMRRQAADRERLRQSLFSCRDQAAERSQLLERRQQELISRQDYEIELATLNERTRIAREIHDNVGHLLTRALLQVKAMQVVSPQESGLAEPLGFLGTTLSDAMDNIRRSVHDLRDDALDLKVSLQALTDTFSFCPVSLDYEAGLLPKTVSYCFLAVCREALSNIAKHSGASRASICVIEHPAFYQLIIRDSGSPKKAGPPPAAPGDSPSAGGIGLLNMQERVEALGGNFCLRTERGFSIFVSVPRRDGEA